jgi:hypothetical protein
VAAVLLDGDECGVSQSQCSVVTRWQGMACTAPQCDAGSCAPCGLHGGATARVLRASPGVQLGGDVGRACWGRGMPQQCVCSFTCGGIHRNQRNAACIPPHFKSSLQVFHSLFKHHKSLTRQSFGS